MQKLWGLGLLVTDSDQLDEAMTTIMNHDGPALLEVRTDVSLI